MTIRSLHAARRAVIAGALLGAALIAACEESVFIPGPPDKGSEFAFVTTSDNATGSSSVVWMDTTLATSKDVVPVHSDAVARFFDDRIYVVNRFGGDNIEVLDPARGFDVIRQFSVGNGSNPHDFLLLSRTRALVTRYDDTHIWIVDPTQGRRVGDIDLSWIADGDGIPEMDQMIRIGDRVFVSVQRVDRDTDWGPVGYSYLVVIDATSYQFVDTDPFVPGVQPLRLTGSNPVSEIVVNPDNGAIIVSTAGRWGIVDGGIDHVALPQLESAGFLIDETDAGGDITDVVMLDATRGAAVVTDASFNTLLIGFDTATADIDTIYAPGEWVLRDAELSPDGFIYVADGTATNPGVRVFRPDTWAQVTATPIDVGLPPFDIQFGRR